VTADTRIRVHRNNKDVGYFTPETARQSLQSGVLRADDWAFCDGLSDWTPLAVLLGQFGIAPASSPIVRPRPVVLTPSPLPRQALPVLPSHTLAHRPGTVAIVTAAVVGLWLLALVYLFNLNAIPEPKIPVSAEEFGGRWPLTVSSGYIIKRERYIPGASFKSYSVIFVSPDGTRYGLNGHALTEGYRNIHAITKSRLLMGEPIYEDVSELIDIGLRGKR
jgi:hypothetical protein